MIQRYILPILFGLIGLPCLSQFRLDSADEKIRTEAVLNQIKNKLASPSGASALSNFVSNINISSSFTEGVNGRIELQTKLKSGWTGGLSAEQKIGKTDEEAIPLSLSGINTGTTLQLHLQKMFWKPGFDDLTTEQIRQLNEAEKRYAQRNGISDYRTVGLREISLNGTEEEKRLALEAFTTSFKTPLFFNARLGFTKSAFNYTTDSVLLSPQSESHLEPTLSVSIIKTLASGFEITGYFALSYNFSVYHQAGRSYNFYIPFGPNFYSRTLTFGKPEYRRNLFASNKVKSFPNIAISPKVNMSIESKMMGIFVPVYFIRAANTEGKIHDNLSAGIRLGYVSSTEKFAPFKTGFISQLIVSAPLDFLKVL